MSNVSQLKRLGLFDSRVPRYTSYPTAPHFSPAVGEAQFRDWLAAVPAGGQISLYLHVPFCRRLCWFCACRTQGTKTLDPVITYVDTVLAELELLRRHLPRGVRLSRLHWGGGTPTLLPPDQMRRVADAIFDVVPMAEGAEFSVEIDPSEIDTARMAALAASGMNRASIGVQDFDPKIQDAIGRQQSFELTGQAVELIRSHDIASLNADILYGLPHQDRTRISETVQKLLALSPDRVALYGYAHVPWMARRQVMIPAEALPEPGGQAAGRLGIARLQPHRGAEAVGDDVLYRDHQPVAEGELAAIEGIGLDRVHRLARVPARQGEVDGAQQDAAQQRHGEQHQRRGAAQDAQPLRAVLAEELNVQRARQPAHQHGDEAAQHPGQHRQPDQAELAGPEPGPEGVRVADGAHMQSESDHGPARGLWQKTAPRHRPRGMDDGKAKSWPPARRAARAGSPGQGGTAEKPGRKRAPRHRAIRGAIQGAIRGAIRGAMPGGGTTGGAERGLRGRPGWLPCAPQPMKCRCPEAR